MESRTPPRVAGTTSRAGLTHTPGAGAAALGACRCCPARGEGSSATPATTPAAKGRRASRCHTCEVTVRDRLHEAATLGERGDLSAVTGARKTMLGFRCASPAHAPTLLHSDSALPPVCSVSVHLIPDTRRGARRLVLLCEVNTQLCAVSACLLPATIAKLST